MFLVGVWGCQGGDTGGGAPVQHASVSIKTGFAAAAMRPARAAGTAADVMTITVEVKDGATVLVGAAPLFYNGVEWLGTINDLPVGPLLTFTGHAFNGSAVELFTGSAAHTMTGQSDQVVITLLPVGGAAQEFPRITLISYAGEIVASTTTPVTVSVEGISGENQSYTISADAAGGSFAPSSGVITLSGTGGTIVTSYAAPAAAGTFANSITVTNSQNNSVTATFGTNVVSSGTGSAATGIEFNPTVLAINGQRSGSDVTFTATVNDDGPLFELRYLWSFDGGLSFADPTANPAVLQGYDQTVSGTLLFTVTDHNGLGGSTTVSYPLSAGQFPDDLTGGGGGPAPGGDCTGCHSTALVKTLGPGGTIRQITGAGGDFNMGAAPIGSRHLFGATTITQWDCTVCHREGALADGSPASGIHNDASGLVHLRNVDTTDEAAGWEINNKTWTTTDYTNMDQFCVSCHDADGASAVAVNAADNGLYTGPDAWSMLRSGWKSMGGTFVGRAAFSPFNSTDWRSGYNAASTSHAAAGEGRARMINVKDQFYAGTVGSGAAYNGNPSQHAVLGQRYSTKNAGWSTAAWSNYVSKRTGVNLKASGETALLSCADCHVLDTGSGAHGGVRKYNLWASTAWGTSADQGICARCHSTTTYSGGGATGGSRYSHSYSRSNASSYGLPQGSSTSIAACFTCHASYNSMSTVGRQNSYGGIHGSWTSVGGAGSTVAGYRFFPGTWRRQAMTTVNYNSTTAGSCYFPNTTTDGFSNCTQHAGIGTSPVTAPGYARPVNY